MTDRDQTLEQYLDEWAQQPGACVTPAERQFIADMRKARFNGVGYGWMQSIIEVEWQSTHGHSWGPRYFEKRIRELEDEIKALSLRRSPAKRVKRRKRTNKQT